MAPSLLHRLALVAVTLLALVCPSFIVTAAAADGTTPTVSARELRSSAEVAAAKGDTAAAIKLYSSLLDVEPSQINYYHRATQYLKKHQYAHALSDLNRAMELDPKFTKGLMYRARVQKITGACDHALIDLRTILAASPNHKEATSELSKVVQCTELVQQAKAMLQAHQYDHAKHILTQAIDIAYDSNALVNMRIQCHAALGDWQSVIVDTRKVLQSNKGDLDALFLRGQAYYYLGEHDNALTHWREGLRSDPEHKQMKEHTKRLKLLVRRMANADAALHSNPKEAIEDIDAALAMDPKHQAIRSGLLLKKCDALKQLKEWSQMADLASQLIAQDESNVEAWVRRGDARMGQQEWDQAIHDYQKATQLNQQHHAAQQGLHQAQVEKKKSLEKDFYKELGIPRDANARVIKKAYRKLALQWHPDKHENDVDKDVAAKKFQAIAEAYEVLSDPEIKAKYDSGQEWRPNQQQQHQHQGHPFQHHFHQGFHQQQHFRWG